VVSTRLEHNSVLRPLNHLRECGLYSLDLVPFNADGVGEPGPPSAPGPEPRPGGLLARQSENKFNTAAAVEDLLQALRDVLRGNA